MKLLCDPWLTGRAFLDGWEHLVTTEETIETIHPTHIWLSHEHPDHFSPRDLLAVPEALRPNITVLYQQTADKKVEGFLRSKGYSVITLAPNEWLDLDENVRILCGSVGADSWSLINAFSKRILNLNDCITGQDILVSDPNRLPLDTLEAMGESVLEPDLLLTQFSYSNWVGNPSDHHLHRLQAETKLNQVRQQIRYLQPKAVCPFASFIWFCHEENFHHNACLNTIDHVTPVIEAEHSTPLILFPGDEWDVGESHDRSQAEIHWRRVYASIETRPRCSSSPIIFDELVKVFDEYRQRLKNKNDWDAILDLKNRGWLAPAQIFLSDLGYSVGFDLCDGLSRSQLPCNRCDITMGSASLAYLMHHNWGRGTLLVNARFSADYEGIHRFLAQTQIAYGNNIGLRFPDTLPESVIKESPSYVAFFARQALKLNASNPR